MGKTRTGSKIYRAMIKRYGKKRGSSIFYGWATLHHNQTAKKHKKILTGKSGRRAARGGKRRR